MSFFTKLPLLPPDPILGLQENFLKDTDSEKINLSIGTLTEKNGLTHCFRSIRTAREILLQQAPQLGYAPLGGEASFKEEIARLLTPDQPMYVHQTVGGTGALFHIFALLKRAGIESVYTTTPAWPNYGNLAAWTSIELKTIPHLSHDETFNFNVYREQISHLSSRDALLIQFSCHNPTGIDPNDEEWDEITSIVQKTGCTLILDMAYLGFASSPHDECTLLQKLKKKNLSYFIALSFAKSLGLYGERVGAAIRVTQDMNERAILESHMKHISRSTHSSAPRFGALLATTVLKTPALRNDWENELTEIRSSFSLVRSTVAEKLSSHLKEGVLLQLRNGKGLFSTLHMTREEVYRLRKKGIWCTDDSRINIGSLHSHMIPKFVEAVRCAMQDTQ